MLRIALTILSASIAFSGASASTASARRVGDVEVPDTIDLGDKRLVLNGAHLYEASIFEIDIFVAALWLETRTSRSGEASRCEGPVEFDFFWLHEPSLGQLTAPWRETMRANAGADLPRLEARIEQLMDALREPLEGDRWRFVYLPETGMTIYFNAKPVTTIVGRDFCQLFIGGHVGPTADAGMRKGLLGKR